MWVPTDIAVDDQGNVYVVDGGNGRQQKLSASGEPLARWRSCGDGAGEFGLRLTRPEADGEGNVWMINPSRRLQIHTAGIAVDGQGDLYGADRQNSRVRKQSPTGEPLAA